MPNRRGRWAEKAVARCGRVLQLLQAVPPEDCGEPAQYGPARFCADFCLSSQPCRTSARQECQEGTGVLRRTDEKTKLLGTGRKVKHWERVPRSHAQPDCCRSVDQAPSSQGWVSLRKPILPLCPIAYRARPSAAAHSRFPWQFSNDVTFITPS